MRTIPSGVSIASEISFTSRSTPQVPFNRMRWKPGATSVVLTYETAKAVGLPLELLQYNVDLQTAGGRTKAARLWLDRLTIGKLEERSVSALVVPHGQLTTNLLGMSFLDRLESFEVRADQLILRAFLEPLALAGDRRGLVLTRK